MKAYDLAEYGIPLLDRHQKPTSTEPQNTAVCYINMSPAAYLNRVLLLVQPALQSSFHLQSSRRKRTIVHDSVASEEFLRSWERNNFE